MQSKSYFEQFKDEIIEDHKVFKTHLESKELSGAKCTHFGRVKAVPGGLRCQCGVGWQGSQLNVLLDHFNRVV